MRSLFLLSVRLSVCNETELLSKQRSFCRICLRHLLGQDLARLWKKQSENIRNRFSPASCCVEEVWKNANYYQYISRYLGSDKAIYKEHSYVQFTEWHYFQWSWVTPTLYFKITTFLDVKWLENGTRQSYTYSKYSSVLYHFLVILTIADW